MRRLALGPPTGLNGRRTWKHGARTLATAFQIGNRHLLISRAPTKAKSQEPAYSQALNQNKIYRQRSRSRESGRQADS